MKPNLFNSIKMMRPKKNVFDLSHDVKMSLDMGKLVPTLALECVPGDSFTISCESLLRLAPMVAPMMHRVDVSMHYFFVPNRIIWKNWETFITGGPEGTSDPEFPYFQMQDVRDYWDTLPTDEEKVNLKKLLSYFGVPWTGDTDFRFNALPFYAYQKVYSEYYRDQNLIPEVYTLADNGTNQSQINTILVQRYRAWEHDYFTASLPWAQRGPAVDIPIGQVGGASPISVANVPSGSNLSGSPANVDVFGTGPVSGIPDGTLFTDGSGLEVEATTINTLRRAFKLQEWLEKNARGGVRYVENILAHFGVKSSDARLQRPEYITGIKSPIVVSEVLNTTGIDGELPQGTMAGHGISVTSGNYGKYFCEEHGWIIGVMSVIPKTAYQQGLHKMWSKFDKLDYFWPSFAHIGEQEVKNKEIYIDSTELEATFGYVPRYAEYKFLPSRVAADFATDLSLQKWHMGRIFDTEPTLSQEFVECKPTKRIFTVTQPNIDSLYAHVYHKIKAVRPMPKFGTPMF